MYLYLHGFGSSPASRKGQAMASAFSERGVKLHLPDLNQPSFAQLSHAAMLATIDDCVAANDSAQSWVLVGSSLGGWLAARWAELHPERVARLVLLCPAFDLGNCWEPLLGAELMARWASDGELRLPDACGGEQPVHYAFYQATLHEPAFPSAGCPTLIVHGRSDEVVPIAHSRRYAKRHHQVRLIEVEDDHALSVTLDATVARTLEFVGLATDAQAR
jgi:pimeloyl-ACP methyl ester carboxylesterase